MARWIYWNMANIITISRITVTPLAVFIFPWSNYLDPSWDLGVRSVVYVLLASTDKLDGIVARIIGNTNGIGKVLDPLADKLMHVYGLTFLWIFQLLDPWLILLITGGEIIVFGIIVRGILLLEKTERVKHKSKLKPAAFNRKYWVSMYRLSKENLISEVEVSDLGKIKMGFYFFGYAFIAANVFWGPVNVLKFFYLTSFISGIVISYSADVRYYKKFEKLKEEAGIDGK